jgi:hypothetical protein
VVVGRGYGGGVANKIEPRAVQVLHTRRPFRRRRPRYGELRALVTHVGQRHMHAVFPLV